MKSLTFREAVYILKTKLDKDARLRKHFSDIVMVLHLLYPNENVERAFQTRMSNEELIKYVESIVLSILKKQGTTKKDIYSIKILPNNKLYIRANGHFNSDESNSCLDIEIAIASKIKIFTGYNVDIRLF